MNKTEDKTDVPPLWLALIPIAITFLSLGVSVFALNAEPHFAMILGSATAGICAYIYGYYWISIREGFKKAISRTIPSLIILLVIGMLMSV